MREAINERVKGVEKSAVSKQMGSIVRGRLTEVENKDVRERKKIKK